MKLSPTITITIPNLPENRTALRDLVDTCFDLQASPPLNRPAKAYRVVGAAIATSLEPEHLDEEDLPTW